MKTSYLKLGLSFGLGGMVVGAALWLLVIRTTTCSVCSECPEDLLGHTTASPRDSADPKSLVNTNVAAFRLLERMLPRNFSIDGSTISFDDINVCDDDTAKIYQMLRRYPGVGTKITAHHYTKIPLCTEDNLPHSYFIPLRDIKAILQEYSDSTITGIRAHVALTTSHLNNLDTLKTHLYLAPAIDQQRDIDVDHFYDLTLPCPSVCPRTNYMATNPCGGSQENRQKTKR